MQATANIPAKIAPTNHPIAIRRLVNFYLFYLNKAVHFNYFLIFLASFLSFSIFIWIAAATNARSFRSSPRYSCGHLYFNPRTRVGCDPLVRLPDPPGGYFNPRTRVGCDAAFCGCSALKTAFQSTHPHGVRLSTLCSPSISLLFQSTHPHGVRLPYSSVQQNWFAFQSTHPHGVRLSLNGDCGLRWLNFNPRTRMGCDSIPHNSHKDGRYFNPRTRMGCDVHIIDPG